MSLLQGLTKLHSKHQLGLWSHSRIEWGRDPLLCSHDYKQNPVPCKMLMDGPKILACCQLKADFSSLTQDPLLSENILGFVFQGAHLGECWFREWFPCKGGFLRKPSQIRNIRLNQTNCPLSLSLNMVTELQRNLCCSTLG